MKFLASSILFLLFFQIVLSMYSEDAFASENNISSTTVRSNVGITFKDSDNVSDSGNSRKEDKLPKTGEMNSNTYNIIGLSLVITIVILWVRKIFSKNLKE